MFNVRLAGDHLYGKMLFTWLSLVMSLMRSFCAVFFFSHEMSWMRSLTELSQFLRASYLHLKKFKSILIETKTWLLHI